MAPFGPATAAVVVPAVIAMVALPAAVIAPVAAVMTAIPAAIMVVAHSMIAIICDGGRRCAKRGNGQASGNEQGF